VSFKHPVDIRLLTVCGSLQGRSANRAALDAASAVAVAEGATVEDFDRLADLPAFDPDRAQERIGMPVNPVIASNRRWNGASDALIREIQANPVIDLTSDRTKGVAGDSMDTGARRHRANDQGS